MSVIYYKKALDIISEGLTPIDADRLLVKLAKAHPKLFCELVESLYYVSPDNNRLKVDKDLVSSIQSILCSKVSRGSTKVAAIKHIRSMTGLSLKEAKEIADSIENDLKEKGVL